MDLSASARRSEHPARFSGNDAGRTIVCGICQAVYAPSRTHKYLLQAPPIALESAFMSMCHFCFRCRRPSCPDCWDTIHGVCGQCAEETRLPFRLRPAPLADMPSLPIHPMIKRSHTGESPLICIVSGRFQGSSPPAIDKIATRPEQPSVVAPQSVTTPRPEARPTTSTTIDIDKIKTRPPASTRRSSRPSSPGPVDKIKTRPEHTLHRKRSSKRYVLTIIAWALLVVVMALIITVWFSPDANTFIASILHIDIRAKIAYLWHLLQQLF